MPMNPEIKAKWVAALRSGEYKKGKACLHPTPDTYCCLGVLCEVVKKEYGEEYSYAADNYYVPNYIQDYVELERDNPSVKVKLSGDTQPRSYSLGNLNDDYNLNFLEIADLIEKQL